MSHFPGLRQVRQRGLLQCGKMPLGRGTLTRRRLLPFLTVAVEHSGNPGIVGGFAITDDLPLRTAALATGGNPSSADQPVPVTAGSLRLVGSTTATAGTSAAAAILHTADVARKT